MSTVIVNGEPETVVQVTSDTVNLLQVGTQGPPGVNGHGVPAGGTTGQILSKASNADYSTEWVNQGSAIWGDITGDISNQSDLNNALNLLGRNVRENRTIFINTDTNLTQEQSQCASIAIIAQTTGLTVTLYDSTENPANYLIYNAGYPIDFVAANSTLHIESGAVVSVQYIYDGGAAIADGATWGSIKGSLSNQTDLYAALQAKQNYTSVVSVSTNYTTQEGDGVINVTSPSTITIKQYPGYDSYTVRNASFGNVVVIGYGTTNINGSPSATLPISGMSLTFKFTPSGWIII